MRPAALGLALVASLASRSAAADWGEIAANGPSPFGGVFPLTETSVRLLGEEVLIRAEGNGTHYRVEARYRMANGGQPAEVLFGVPVNGAGSERLTGTIRFALGGKETGCELRAAGALAAGPLSPQVWCVATLVVPSGGDLLLVLRYRGELEYGDRDFGRSPHVTERRLVHPLSPAGYWSAPPERLRVKIDLSILPGVAVEAQPPPTKQKLLLLEWSFDGDAVREVRDLGVTLTLKWNFRDRDVAGGGGRANASARASSVLEPAADYSAAHVADGNPLTAWCEGAPGNGKGQWVELRVAPAWREGLICGLTRIGVIPGHGALMRYRAERRPGQIRLSACGSERSIVDTKVSRTARDPNTEMTIIDLPDGSPDSLNNCLRITILGARGTQTCISEIVPFFACAMPLN